MIKKIDDRCDAIKSVAIMQDKIPSAGDTIKYFKDLAAKNGKEIKTFKNTSLTKH